MYPRQKSFYTGHNDADLPPERTHRRKKRRKTARIVITAILLCLAVTAGWQLRKLPDREIISDILSSISGETMSQLNSTETEENGWQLILVNREHPLPDNYQVELTELSNGEKVAASIYPALQQMFDDMRAEGIYPVVVSGYRTDEEQQQILNDKTASYRAEGYSDADASALAEDWVAIPGTSEHQTGLAVDINADGINSAGYEVYDWLSNHAHEYGFIKRYPEDKIELTGISNEPWHYRYVGRSAAGEIYKKGLCLEEYLG